MSITLKAARVNAGLTLEEASEKTGFNSMSISNWEHNRHEPRLSKLNKLCEVYGVSLDQVDLSHWQ